MGDSIDFGKGNTFDRTNVKGEQTNTETEERTETRETRTTTTTAVTQRPSFWVTLIGSLSALAGLVWKGKELWEWVSGLMST